MFPHLPGIQICNRHSVDDPVEFVEQWFAFSCSKLNGAEPTLDNLRDMESHEYANRSRKPAASNPSLARIRHSEVAVVAGSSGSGGSRASTSGLEAGDLSGRSGGAGGSGGLVIYSNAEENEIENEVLGSYGCHTPKVGGNSGY